MIDMQVEAKSQYNIFKSLTVALWNAVVNIFKYKQRFMVAHPHLKLQYIESWEICMSGWEAQQKNYIRKST